MNIETGQLVDFSEIEKMPENQKRKLVEVKRDLSAKERFEKQIKLYAPCGCGSKKKFKFCCYTKS
jgi:uncharacterized protein YchJ